MSRDLNEDNKHLSVKIGIEEISVRTQNQWRNGWKLDRSNMVEDSKSDGFWVSKRHYYYYLAGQRAKVSLFYLVTTRNVTQKWVFDIFLKSCTAYVQRTSTLLLGL